MTEKLKCVICGEELEPCEGRPKCFTCENYCCRMVNRRLDPFLLKLLQDGKKAQDALKKLIEMYAAAGLQEIEKLMNDE